VCIFDCPPQRHHPRGPCHRPERAVGASFYFDQPVVTHMRESACTSTSQHLHPKSPALREPPWRRPRRRRTPANRLGAPPQPRQAEQMEGLPEQTRRATNRPSHRLGRPLANMDKANPQEKAPRHRSEGAGWDSRSRGKSAAGWSQGPSLEPAAFGGWSWGPCRRSSATPGWFQEPFAQATASSRWCPEACLNRIGFARPCLDNLYTI
jgi:hypothetical protein